MDQIINNWAVVVAAICMIIMVVTFVINFFQKPTSKQLEQCFQWLQFAVIEAEKALGAGTGKLKLRYVYDMFLTKFDYIAKLISFEQFSELVDKALAEMKRLLSENKNIQEYVGIEVTQTETEKTE